nr:LLM class flavin-dependent oxidoreductase [Micromonospora sp. DSM 115978]
VYREFQVWLGRQDALKGMWDAWEARDRKGALAAIPDEVVDELVIHGSVEQCRAGLRRYVDHGVTTPVAALLNGGAELPDVLRGLAPR